MATEKNVTYTWSEEDSENEGMITLVIPTAGEPYRIDVSVDADDFAKVSTVVSVQFSLGKPT